MSSLLPAVYPLCWLKSKLLDMLQPVPILLAMMAFLPIGLSAQVRDTTPVRPLNAKGMAIGISDSQLIDQLMTIVAKVGTDSREMFMERTVKPYMMPPRNTGTSGHSLAYAITNCMEYYLNLNNNFKDNLSPDYIVLNTEAPQKKANADDMFTFLVLNGTVSAAIMPYYSRSIPIGANSSAKVKAENFLHVFYETAKTSYKIFEVRKALTRGHPVIVELAITRGFRAIRDSRYWQPETSDNSPDGMHYVTVVGFDEQRRAVEILNCWGIEWGNDGYLWVNYDDFGKYARNGYVILP